MMVANNSTNFGGILLQPVALLGYLFRMVLYQYLLQMHWQSEINLFVKDFLLLVLFSDVFYMNEWYVLLFPYLWSRIRVKYINFQNIYYHL